MPKNKILYILIQNKIVIIIINWFFQGSIGLSKIDMFGKIFIETLAFIVVLMVIGDISIFKIIISLFIAHTINWLINTNFWVLGRFIGITKISTKSYYEYLENLQSRINKSNSLCGVIVIGGVSRGQQLRINSDIDIYFIAKSDIKLKIFALLLTIRERIFAFFYRFPLDLYLYEKLPNMNKHRNDEIPFILLDPEKKVVDYYQKQNRDFTYIDSYPKY